MPQMAEEKLEAWNNGFESGVKSTKHNNIDLIQDTLKTSRITLQAIHKEKTTMRWQSYVHIFLSFLGVLTSLGICYTLYVISQHITSIL